MGKKFKNFYDKIYYQDVCGYADTFFNDILKEKWRTCDHVTNDSGQFGLSVLLTFFYKNHYFLHLIMTYQFHIP